MFPSAFCRCTFCLDEFFHYCNKRAIRPGLSARYPDPHKPKKISLPLMQVREGNLVDVIADLEDTLLAPNLISGTNAVGH